MIVDGEDERKRKRLIAVNSEELKMTKGKGIKKENIKNFFRKIKIKNYNLWRIN